MKQAVGVGSPVIKFFDLMPFPLILEVEIAKHESENSWADREGELKMKLAQLTTEKKTLEMTLKLRDNEIKSRKEENRGER